MLLLSLALVVALLLSEVRRRRQLSGSIWVAVAWLILIGSRPVSTWLSSGASGSAESYDEGNPLERLVYFLLISLGAAALALRNFRISEFLQANKWLAIFFGYCALSILWSDSPFVSLKRWIKDLGNVVIVLLILTEKDPVEAAKAVVLRAAIVLIPVSVLLIRFYSSLGRTYHVWSGEMMYTGVTTHKNMLGVIVLVCGLFLFWELSSALGAKKRKWLFLFSDLLLFLMALWLLQKARSATALACFGVGLCIYTLLGTRFVQKRLNRLLAYFIGASLFVWALNLMVDLKKLIIVDILGRDLTLTTRTEVWPMLLEQNKNVLFGTGFNSFWSGERLELIINQLGIIQAHNGYLETYLNGGLAGLALLLIVLFTSFRRSISQLATGGDFARMRFAFLMIALIYNFTEAAFNKMGLVWFALLLAIIQAPRMLRGMSASRERAGELVINRAGVL